MKNSYSITLILFFTLISTLAKAQNPLFPNSVDSNDIDFILATDEDVFESHTYLGLADKERQVMHIPNRLVFFSNLYSNCSFDLADAVVTENISIYPNPISNALFSTIALVQNDEAINIYSSIGGMVKSIIPQQGQNEIDLRKFQAVCAF